MRRGMSKDDIVIMVRDDLGKVVVQAEGMTARLWALVQTGQ